MDDEQEAASDSHVVTAVQAERMIARTLQRLEEATADHAKVCDYAAECEAAYRHAKGYKALAIIRADGISAKERDARIELELHDERKSHLHAQAAKESSAENLRTLRARLQALTVVSASVRTGAGA